MQEFTDEQLVHNYLKNKDEQALEELVQRYLPLIYGYVRRYTGNTDNASDIAQEVFVKVWKNIKKFDQSKSFKSWIFTIAKNTSIDYLKKKKALPFSVLDAAGEEGMAFADTLADETSSVHDRAVQGETARVLAVALEQLPRSYSSVIDLHINSGMNFREIAASFREPLNTVKSRYRRGLAMLRKHLGKNPLD